MHFTYSARAGARAVLGATLFVTLQAACFSGSAAAQQPEPQPSTQAPQTAPVASASSAGATEKKLTPEEMQRESWRQSMLRPSDSQTGCFQATYPDKDWKAVPCVEAPNRPYGSPSPQTGGVKPRDVGDTNGDYRMQSTGTVHSAEGNFPDVLYLTSESGPGTNAQNQWSLQLNTNTWSSTACSSSTTTSCQGWEQFVFSNGGNLFIQTWLISYSSTCPAGWNKYGSNDCWKNSTSIPVPVQPLANLAKLNLQGAAVSGGVDTIILSTPGGLYRTTAADSVLNLGAGSNWTSAEFNIFGDSGAVKATFNQGALLSVQVLQNDNTANFDSCIGGSTTGETTNFTLTTWCNQIGGSGSRGIKFAEATPPTINSIGPNVGSTAGGTAVTVNGTGFASSVVASFGTFGDTVANCTPTQCVFQSPKGTGPVDITVANTNSTFALNGAFSTPTPADRFTYEAFPEGYMQPSTGPVTGGTAVTINGQNFSTTPGATIVRFNLNGVLTAPPSLSCSSTTICTMTTPPFPSANPGQVVPVTMTVNGMSSSIGGFTYGVKPPTPPPPTCAQCVQNGGRCVIKAGKVTCVGIMGKPCAAQPEIQPAAPGKGSSVPLNFQ